MAKTEDQRWRVGELASVSGVTVRALHHYDRLGLLVPSQRTAAGHRLYVDDDVQRLYRIVALRQLGLRLRDISAALDGDEGALTAVVRRHLERVEHDLERQRRLQTRLAGILRTLEHSGEPPAGQFIEIMEAMVVTADVLEIARILGVSRQRATALTLSATDFPAPTDEHSGRALWVRAQIVSWAAAHPQRGPAWKRPATPSGCEPDAWTSKLLRLLGRQSKQLNYGWIGDEHLLLALLDDDCAGAAPAVLRSFGLSEQVLRAAIIELVGEPDASASRRMIKLCRHTQDVLQRAPMKAVELHDEEVASEHTLLALLEAQPDSSALSLLRSAGVDPPALADRLLAATDAGDGDTRLIADAGAVPDEVHAADVARILGVSRARVVELAADAADFPGSRMTTGGHRVWPRAEIEEWAARSPGAGARSRGAESPLPGSKTPGLGDMRRLAIAEARALNHSTVMSEHLVLALLHPGCSGEAGAVLRSFGVTLVEARRRYVESMGDPFEPDDRDPEVPPHTHQMLENATAIARELEDEHAGTEHLLLALMQRWGFFDWLAEIDAATLHERLMARTDGLLPAQQPTAPLPRLEGISPVRVPRSQEPELALSPAGHDPRRRRPWSARVFEIQGRPWSPANGQYWTDRDGYAILTRDGQPVHTLEDEHGRTILGEDGRAIFTAIPVPAGSHVRLHPYAG